jgi:peptide/nickel transport system permease protein
MLNLVAKRAVVLVLTMLAVSLLVFLALEFNIESVAVRVLGPYSTQEQREIWLEVNGYLQPAWVRYVEWLGRFLSGDFGMSTRFRVPVGDVLWPRLANTALLGAVTFAVMVPIALFFGVISGMKEGSALDRGVSTLCILTTSVPEFASAVLLSFIFVFALGWLPGVSNMATGFDPVALIMPVMVLVLYGFGYIARMTRASMAEVMQTAYIRTAILKGLPYREVILRHALRNALIAPFTVIVLQINWLLSGVIVVEYFFAYKGFGALLLEAALNQDVYLVQACAMIAVIVAVGTQLIADIGYTFLNPRIRFQGT